MWHGRAEASLEIWCGVDRCPVTVAVHRPRSSLYYSDVQRWSCWSDRWTPGPCRRRSPAASRWRTAVRCCGAPRPASAGVARSCSRGSGCQTRHQMPSYSAARSTDIRQSCGSNFWSTESAAIWELGQEWSQSSEQFWGLPAVRRLPLFELSELQLDCYR